MSGYILKVQSKKLHNSFLLRSTTLSSCYSYKLIKVITANCTETNRNIQLSHTNFIVVFYCGAFFITINN